MNWILKLLSSLLILSFLYYTWYVYGLLVLPFIMLYIPLVILLDEINEWYIILSLFLGINLYIIVLYISRSIDPIGFMWLILVMISLYWYRDIRGYRIINFSKAIIVSKICILILIALFISSILTIYPLGINFPLIIYLITVFILAWILIIVTKRYIII